MTTETKPVNLALQGGGAHGAFTWGVLDRLLEDGRTTFEGVSGTSAGAMNAVLLADGLMQDGADGARQLLHDFWRDVSRAAMASPLQRSPLSMFMGSWSLDDSPGYLFMDMLSRLASPYDLNPLNVNPLADIIGSHVDFDRVRACTRTKLFISATNVHTGRVRVFETSEITPDAVMASACLPFLFQAVEIDGVPYWDGGYMGNPALFPFFNACATDDILLVQINPIERKHTPKTAREIMNRMNEITFNASLMKEFRAIDFVDRLIDEGKLSTDHYKQVRLHRIAGDREMVDLSASSKLNAEWEFLTWLRDLGRDTASAWLAAHYDKIGREASVDLRSLFD
jgi:NTE family protein